MARTASYKVVRKLDGTAEIPNVPMTSSQFEQAKKNMQAENARVEALQRPTTPNGKVLTTTEIRSRILAAMHKVDYDPVMELINMATYKQDGEYVYDAKFRKEIHLELAQFIAPKLKSTDVQVEGSIAINVTVQKFSQPPGENAKKVEQAKVETVDV